MKKALIFTGIALAATVFSIDKNEHALVVTVNNVQAFSSSCQGVYQSTYDYFFSVSSDAQFSHRQASFAYYNCINAGEWQVPQPPH